MKRSFLIVIAIIIVLTLVGCNNGKTTPIEINEPNSYESVDEELITDNTQVVSELLVRTESFVLADGSSLNFEIRIPYININSEDIKPLNEYFNAFKEFVEKIANNPDIAYDDEYWTNDFVKAGLDMYSFNYEYSMVNNKILSLMTNSYYMDGGTMPELGDYTVYNIDINSGKLLTTSEVLGTEKTKKVQDHIEDFYMVGFEELNKEYLERNEFESYYNSARETIKETITKNINDIPCYDGKLVIKTFGPPVGVTGDEPYWTVFVDIDGVLNRLDN